MGRNNEQQLLLEEGSLNADGAGQEDAKFSARITKENVLRLLDMVSIAMRLAAPGLMVAANAHDKPVDGVAGPIGMTGIMSAGAIGELFITFKPDLTLAGLPVGQKLAGALAPALALLTVGVMLGINVDGSQVNPFVVSALTIFALPAIMQIVVGAELIKKMGLHQYILASKCVELVALGLFAFATYMGMQQNPKLKDQFVGVSMLGADTFFQIGKHALLARAATNESTGQQQSAQV